MNDMKKEFKKELTLLIVGGLVYLLIELLWRGHTHWSMGIVGGICFVIIGLINELFPMEMYIELQAMISAVCITIVEYIAGRVINIRLGWNVWDYSNLPFNIEGQVCLLFAFFWFWLAIFGIVLDDGLRYKLWKEDKPEYRSFVYNKFKKYFES